MIHNELEKPPDKTIRCLLCGEPLVVTHHWIAVINRWMHAGCHDRCVEEWKKQTRSAVPWNYDDKIPERFREFDSNMADKRVIAACGAFSHESKVKTLALIGVRARGKSRLMWQIIKQFFDYLEATTGMRRWVDYFLFTDLVGEVDKTALAKLKMSKHAFLDDVGSVESYGRDRAALQQIIRTRIQKGQDWTFLTIDSMTFDDGLEDVLRGRAVTVYLDQ